jgi:hypothetical protein
VGMKNWMMVPAGVIRPILFLPNSVNHTLPSGPVVIPNVPPVEPGNSVITPAVVIRPMLSVLSVNQRFPSGPTVIPRGPLKGVGMGNSVMTPVVVIRPMLLAPYSANHRFPSGPAVIPRGAVSAALASSLNRVATLPL